MKTQIVYSVISTEKDFFLEELWVSVYSLRQFHPNDRVVVMTDAPTGERIKRRPSLDCLISEVMVIPMPEGYNNDCRAREIKTNIRNLIDGDFLFIDTDTVICQPLDEVDNLPVKNLAMVPEFHDSFKKHFCYEFVYQDVIRIFCTDCSDSQYWFNSGCMFVRDNETTRKFFADWKKNWTYSAFEKNENSDQRALLKTDHDYGYIIETLPGVYNCQVAVSIQYFFDAKIVHFWHMRAKFTSDMNYSPFTNKEIYKQIHQDNCISQSVADTIIHCKSSFRSPSMIVGDAEMRFVMSSFNTILNKAYKESKLMRSLINGFTKLTYYYLRAKAKLGK